MNGFKCTIEYCSKELTAKEKVGIKDTTNALRLDELTADNKKLVIAPAFYAVLDIENENSESKNYKNYIIVDKDGNKYVTGSEAFYSSFADIAADMGDEAYELEIYRRESKNYKGKSFITCSIVM